jgi:hypothetical protein
MAKEELIAKNKAQTAANRQIKVSNSEGAREKKAIKEVVNQIKKKTAKGETGLTKESRSSAIKKPYEKSEQKVNMSGVKTPYNVDIAKAKKEAKTYLVQAKAAETKKVTQKQTTSSVKGGPKGSQTGGSRTYKPQSLDVVVIDESDEYTFQPSILEDQWQNYRSEHRREALVVLRVKRDDGLQIGSPQKLNSYSEYAADDWENEIVYPANTYTGYYEVNRSGEGQPLSNWFPILKPWAMFAGEIRFAIDSSGSMDFDTIQPDYDKFIQDFRRPTNYVTKIDATKPISYAPQYDERWAEWLTVRNNLSEYLSE